MSAAPNLDFSFEFFPPKTPQGRDKLRGALFTLSRIFEVARNWAGNGMKTAAYDYMLSYSPYDQVSAQDYPNLMVTTGLNDSQVQYFEPAKWVARLRDRRTDNNRSGHAHEYGRGARRRVRTLPPYEETSREYAFMVDLAGIEH